MSEKINIVLPILHGVQEKYNALSVKELDKIYICHDTGNMYIGDIPLAKDILYKDDVNDLTSDFGRVGDFCITPSGVYIKTLFEGTGIIAVCAADSNISGAWEDKGINDVSDDTGSSPSGTHWYLHNSGDYLACWTTQNGGNWWINKVVDGDTISARKQYLDNSYLFKSTSLSEAIKGISSGPYVRVPNSVIKLDWINLNDSGNWILYSNWEVDSDGKLFINGKEFQSGSNTLIDIESECDALHVGIDDEYNVKLFVDSDRLQTTLVSDNDSELNWEVDKDPVLFVNHVDANDINITVSLSDISTSKYDKLYSRHGKLIVINSNDEESNIKIKLDSSIGTTINWNVDPTSKLSANTVYMFEIWMIPSSAGNIVTVLGKFESHGGNTNAIATLQNLGIVRSTSADDTDSLGSTNIFDWATIYVDPITGKMKVNNLDKIFEEKLKSVYRYSTDGN